MVIVKESNGRIVSNYILFGVGQPLHLPCLFVNIEVKDYVPTRYNGIAEALANPIKYQQDILTERALALEALEDEVSEWFGGWLVGWVVGWLVGCLLAWMVGWVDGWLDGFGDWMVCWFNGWLDGSLVG